MAGCDCLEIWGAHISTLVGAVINLPLWSPPKWRRLVLAGTKLSGEPLGLRSNGKEAVLGQTCFILFMLLLSLHLNV